MSCGEETAAGAQEEGNFTLGTHRDGLGFCQE